MAQILSASSIVEFNHSELDFENGKLNKVTDPTSEYAHKDGPLHSGHGSYPANTVCESPDNLSSAETFDLKSRGNDSNKDISSNTFKQSESPRQEEYDIEDPDTICGFGSFRPKCLQTWATPKTFFFLHSLYAIVSGTYYSYRVGVMSTLEMRFAFKSKTTGAIMIFDELTPVLFGALIGYFGGRTHRPRVLGLGTLLSALCCFISALPYFIYGPAKHFDGLNSAMLKNGSDWEQCDGSLRLDECDADDRPPTFTVVVLFMVAGLVKGFSSIAYISIGFSYMDDIIERKNSPMYFAILFVLRLLGPLLGFAMASFCLKYFENPFDDPGYGPDDPRWVGAWWIGFVLEGFLLLLVAIPISMFPKMPPGVKKPINRPETDKRVNFSGMFAALKRVLLNSLLWVIMVNDIISLYGTVGHHIMLPKYMEHQFRLTASDASLYSGVPGLAAVMVSVLLGGYLVWKFRPTMKFLFGSMIVLEVIGACGFLILMIPKCEKLEMANFGMEDDGLILEGSCNMNCNCSRKSFTPVCGSDLRTLYFSPCYAGCEKSLNKTFFNNCSCIPELGNFEKYATEGFCMPESCWQQALTYIIAWPTIQFIVSLLRVMQQVLLLRCTQHQDKSLALAMFEGITVVLGIVPYLVIFGSMVDSACLVFESSCEETGNCWFYDTDKLNNILHGMSAGFSFLSVGTMYLLYTMRDRFSDMYEEDIFNEEKKDVDENPDAKKADE